MESEKVFNQAIAQDSDELDQINDPAPDTTFRLFLDYLPLATRPKNTPQPQIMERLVRNGFTLVEWGGKKLY